MMATLEEITEGMRDRVGEDSGLDATLKFDFGDDGVVFVDGASSPNTVSNEDKDADCTMKISKENFLAMVNGDLDGTTAFMMGKLKIEGNMGVAMKLQSVLRG
jgi:putative sterol carrier protein